MKKEFSVACALGVSAILCSQAGLAEPAAPVVQSNASDRQAVAVTIYENFALVREERTLPLKQGVNRIALREVSGRIQPETATIRNLSGGKIELIEQNYDFDLLTPQKLLEKYVGQQVDILRRDPVKGGEQREKATVLSAANGGLVLRYADRIETGLPEHARIAYGDVPATLRDRPTLIVDLNSQKAGRERLELSYLSGGFSWRADYIASLAADEQKIDLSGWVTLTNASGSAYEQAKLQLVAGDVNYRPTSPTNAAPRADVAYMIVEREAPMRQQDLFEYHLYTLTRPTTLLDNQTKQVALLSAQSIPVTKEYRMEGAPRWWEYRRNQLPEQGEQRAVEVFLEFANKKPLGQPLPKGAIRVYKKDDAGQPLFVGEDRIEHTPRNATVHLKLGKAFDVTGLRKRTDHVTLGSTEEMEISIELSNAKKQPVTVKVVEPMPGDWKIVKASHLHQKTADSLALWQIKVPADGKATLTYRVRWTPFR